MRARLCVIPLVFFATAAIGAETASQAFARLPPLAKEASPNLDCSAEEATGKKVQAQLMPAMKAASSMSYGGSAVQMTPAQMQAITAMSDPAFNECVSAQQMNPGDQWVQPLKDTLDAKLQQVEAGWQKATDEFCRRKAPDEPCMGDPAIDKRFNGQATAAGTQLLKDAQAPYARYLKDVGDCVSMRDKAMGGASGGGNAAMDAIFASTAGTTWGLLNLPAAVNTRLCEAAREAARKHLRQP